MDAIDIRSTNFDDIPKKEKVKTNHELLRDFHHELIEAQRLKNEEAKKSK